MIQSRPGRARRGRAVAAAMFSVAVACGAGGCLQDPIRFDPREVSKWDTAQDPSLHMPTEEALPTTVSTESDPVGASRYRRDTLNVDEGPPIPMSLQEIVHRAVSNNLDIRVAAYDTAIDQTRVIEAQGAFDPVVFSDFSFQRVNKGTAGTEISQPNTGNPNTNNVSSAFPGTLESVSRIDIENQGVFDIGFRQNTSTGAQFSIKQEVQYSWFQPARTLLNPYYENDLVVSLTQPLLQNFGTDVNTARIKIARNNQRISLLDFRKTVETTVLKVEQDYWELAQAQRDVETVEKLIDESIKTTQILQKRGLLDATSPQIYQAKAETANRRVQLATVRSRMFSISDDLKRLMNDPRYPVAGSGVITASDGLPDVPLRFNLEDQIETGMRNRLELGQQQVRVESSQIADDVAHNGTLPQFDLQLQGMVDGLAHSLTNAFSDEGNFHHLGGTFGFQFSYPLGNRAPHAVEERARLQELQAILSYGVLTKQVAEDVKGAARSVDTAWLQLAAARESRLNYQALIDKLDILISLGAADQFTFDQIFIRLQDQQQLATAEQQEHQALNDYNYAIAQLEAAKGTILRYNNVILEQDSRPLDQLNQYGGKYGTPFELINKDQ
jgi:outer membrane protein TolC